MSKFHLLAIAFLLVSWPVLGESVRLPDGSVLEVDELSIDGDYIHVRLGEIAFLLPTSDTKVLSTVEPMQQEVKSWTEGLQNPDPASRRLAVAALSVVDDPAARDALLGALEDEAPEVRAEAVRSLRENEAALPTDRLLQMIQNESDTPLRVAAIDAIAARGGDEGRGWLEQLATDAEPSIRQAVRAALRRLQQR